jgi:hypothetical protein
MSKTEKTDAELNLEDHSQNEGQPDNQNPGGAPSPEGNPDSKDDPKSKKKDGDKKDGIELLTVEELAMRQSIAAPIFAAVLQSENWVSGKKVTEMVFKGAVDAFLNAPMGGKKPPEKKEEK